MKYDPKNNAIVATPRQAKTLLMASTIRERVDPAELVDFWLDILRGRATSVKEKMEAAAQLADRGWGKAPQHVIIDQPSGSDSDVALDGLTSEQLKFLRAAIDSEQAARDPRNKAEHLVELSLDAVPDELLPSTED